MASCCFGKVSHVAGQREERDLADAQGSCAAAEKNGNISFAETSIDPGEKVSTALGVLKKVMPDLSPVKPLERW
jgi:hypothetical protein